MARKSIELPKASTDASHRRRFNELLKNAKRAETVRDASSSSSGDQHKRFVEAARELRCDEDEAAFDRKLRKIATAPASPRSQGRERKPTKRVK